jgi:hypothetical protein
MHPELLLLPSLRWFQGFDFRVSFQISQGTELTAGAYLSTKGRAGYANDPEELVTLFVIADFVVPAAGPGAADKMTNFDTYLHKAERFGYNTFPRAGSITAVSDLAPWIKDGKMVFKAVFRSVDEQEVK